MDKKLLFAAAMCAVTLSSQAQHNHDHHHHHELPDSAGGMESREHQLREVTVSSAAGTRRIGGAVNGVSIGRKEMLRHACCNLGESFVSNPAVDVTYSDAATGAKQIKLLGLSGIYVQMLSENIPNFRGAAMPYALGYVPGAWMNNISVSKGNSSVKHGYEAITGQIDIGYLKPEAEQKLEVNVYGNTKTKLEANVAGNIHINDELSTVVMGHYEDNIEEHDDNDDGFYDQPKVRQFNAMNRWLWNAGHYIFHGGVSFLTEKRQGGQKHLAAGQTQPLFDIDLQTNRVEGFMKHAYMFDHDHNSSIALLATASMHELDAIYGSKKYYVNEKNLYASLVFETDFTHNHTLSTGVSINHDYFGQHVNDGGYGMMVGGMGMTDAALAAKETVPGAYLQYTYKLGHKFTAMAGARIDHSNIHGTFFTPRFHVKYQPHEVVGLRLSAGKGYRTVHALAENNFLLASGRTLVIDNLEQEEAWNYGVSAALNIPLFGKNLKVNAEYYFTDFQNQAVVDYDSDPTEIHIGNLTGDSYSHTFQVDATYPFFKGFTLTAAYRLNDVKTTFDGVLMEKPLTSKYKGLFTAQYKTPGDKWQFDVTLQLNGGGRMPQPYEAADGTLSWPERFKAFEQLSAQITREFKHFSVYVGGENLTGYTQDNPIVGASDPWGKSFDPTMVWGPENGRVFYAGLRMTL